MISTLPTPPPPACLALSPASSVCCIGCFSSLPATSPYGNFLSPQLEGASLFAREGGGGACGGREGEAVLLLGPDGPEGPPAAWGSSLCTVLWLRPFQLLYLCFSAPSSISNFWCNRDHLYLALSLKPQVYFHPPGLWDELGEQVPPSQENWKAFDPVLE